MQTLPVDPISMPHDFLITQRHLLVMIPPLYYEPAAAGAAGNAAPARSGGASPDTFLGAHVWRPERPARLLVANKNDVTEHFWVDLPAQWVFHYGNAWEDSTGVIRFDGARSADPMAMIESFREIMRGVLVPAPGSHHTMYRVDTKARTVSESPLSGDIDTEFPAIDPRVATRRHRRVIVLSADSRTPGRTGGLTSVSSLNIDSGVMATYRYPDERIPEEHLYVPAPGASPETGGWVVGTALDWRARRTELNVFDADHVDDGPVATARLPYHLPLGLHGKFHAA